MRVVLQHCWCNHQNPLAFHRILQHNIRSLTGVVVETASKCALQPYAFFSEWDNVRKIKRLPQKTDIGESVSHIMDRKVKRFCLKELLKDSNR